MAGTKSKLDAETYLQQFPNYEAFDAASIDAVDAEPAVPWWQDDGVYPEQGPPVILSNGFKDKDA